MTRVKFLVEQSKKNARAKDDDARQPLHWAASGGHASVAVYLLDECACDVDAEDDAGFTPLHIAASANHLDIVTLLLEHRASASATTSRGQTGITPCVETLPS